MGLGRSFVEAVSYEPGEGKSMIDGTAYGIIRGKTMVDGTAYDIGGEMILLSWSGASQSGKVGITVDGADYYGSGSMELSRGSQITIFARDLGGWVYLNGKRVAGNGKYNPFTYSMEAEYNTTVKFKESYDSGEDSDYWKIEITEIQ